MSDTPTLKPCPFCGSEVTIEDRGDGDLFVILCPEGSPCIGSGFANYGLRSKKAEAITAWNTRPDAHVAALVEALENINLKASPRPDRTLDECADELYWCASEARQALAAF